MKYDEEELPKPPEDISFAADTDRRWAKMRKDADAGLPTAVDIALLEAELEEGRADIERGRLPDGFNWAVDIRTAEILHKQNIAYQQHRREALDRYCAFWDDEVKNKSELSAKIALAGFQILFAMNGAIALGALNGLTDNPKSPLDSVFIFALIASVIGILLTGGAHWAMAETLGHYARNIKPELVESRSWKKLKALHRYTRRIKTFRRTSWLMYSAIIWLGAYVLICLTLILASR